MSTDRHETDSREVTRRLFQRIDVGVQAVVIHTPSATPQAPVALTGPMVVDISATGACIQVQESDVVVADELALDFALDGVAYHAVGVVVWVRPLPEIAAARLGLRFEGMAQAQKSQLARHIVMKKHHLPSRPTSATHAAPRPS
jgi:hypothetical protein